MPDFNRYTNYTSETSFSGVVFGAQAPVLEVELNEVQEILTHKLGLLSTFIGGNLLIPSNGSITYNKNNGALTLTNCVVVSDGFFVQVPTAQVTLSAVNKYAYLRLEEKVATSQTTLKSYGNTTGKTITNPIIDPRVGVETSRRKVITYTLQCGTSVPKTIDNVHIVKVGTLSGSEFKVENMVDSLAGVMNSVHNVDSQLRNDLIRGEISAPIVLSENSDEVLTTDGTTPLEALVYLYDDQNRLLYKVSTMIEEVVKLLRSEFQYALSQHDSSTQAHPPFLLSQDSPVVTEET